MWYKFICYINEEGSMWGVVWVRKIGIKEVEWWIDEYICSTNGVVSMNV